MSVCMDNVTIEFSQLRQSCRTGDLESISDFSTPISELVKIQDKEFGKFNLQK